MSMFDTCGRFYYYMQRKNTIALHTYLEGIISYFDKKGADCALIWC